MWHNVNFCFTNLAKNVIVQTTLSEKILQFKMTFGKFYSMAKAGSAWANEY